MRFMLLFYEPASAPRCDPAEFDAELRRRGVVAASLALEQPEDATTVRLQSGSMARSQGSLVDADENLVGLRIVDCPDQAAAVALAALAPSAHTGSVEVRALHETVILPDSNAPSR